MTSIKLFSIYFILFFLFPSVCLSVEESKPVQNVGISNNPVKDNTYNTIPVITDFGKTVEELFIDNIYQKDNLGEYFPPKNNVYTPEVSDCGSLRDILKGIEGTYPERPVYIKLNLELTIDAKTREKEGIDTDTGCTLNEDTFVITRNSDVILDGGGDFLIWQNDDATQLENEPLVKVLTDKHVVFKGFNLKGGRTGIEAGAHSRVYMGDIDIIDQAKEGILINHSDTEITKQQATSGFSIYRAAHAAEITAVCGRRMHNSTSTVGITSCLYVFGLVEIKPTAGNTLEKGVNINNGTLEIRDGATLKIGPRVKTGIDVHQAGNIKFIGVENDETSGKIDIKYTETGIRFNGGKMICNKHYPFERFVFRGSKAPLAINASRDNHTPNINSCIRNVGKFDSNNTMDMVLTSSGPDKVWLYRYWRNKWVKPIELIQQGAGFKIAGIGDFNRDGTDDIFLRNSNGTNRIYLIKNAEVNEWKNINTVPDQNWQVIGVGDFNRDRSDDILWRNKSNNKLHVYLMNGLSILKQEKINNGIPITNWNIVSVSDMDGDGINDLLWKNKRHGGLHQFNKFSDQNFKFTGSYSVPSTIIKGVAEVRCKPQTCLQYCNPGRKAYSVILTQSLSTVPYIYRSNKWQVPKNGCKPVIDDLKIFKTNAFNSIGKTY